MKAFQGQVGQDAEGRSLEVGADDLVGARVERRVLKARRRAVVLAAVLCLAVLRDLYFPNALFIPHLSLPASSMIWLPSVLLIAVLGLVMVLPYLGLGRSPHFRHRSEGGDGLGKLLGEERLTTELSGIIDQLRWHRSLEANLGGRVANGLLFEGPPGTGKTLAARAISEEISVPFMVVSASSFQSMYYGQTNRKIRSFFKSVRKAADKEGAAIGFIDEIDAIGTSRSAMGSAGNRDGVAGVVTELLVQLQSINAPSRGEKLLATLVRQSPRPVATLLEILFPPLPKGKAMFIAATNRASELDPALVRPGRFDRSIHFDLPTAQKRRQIILGLLATRPCGASILGAVDLVASETGGLSHASISRLVEESAAIAWQRGGSTIESSDLWDALAKLRIGLAEGSPYSSDQRRRIAVHEGGHAVVGWFTSGIGRVELVSILKRGSALGLTARAPEEDQFLVSESQLRGEIATSLAGLCAEELILAEGSSGAASDLARSTDLAVQMVGRFGLVGSLISLDAVRNTDLVAATLSDSRLRELVDGILNTERENALNILRLNRDRLERLVKALLEREELGHADLRDILGDRPSAESIDLRDQVVSSSDRTGTLNE